MGYAFISYSTKNQKAADVICDLLKKHDIATWMAPGDMPAGSKYSRAINQAIIECSCFLLILSSDSQDSIWVRKELECAYSYRKSILPIRIGPVALNDEFKFYIGAKRVLTMPKADEDPEKVMKFLKRIHTATMADDGGMHDMFARQTSTQGIDYWKYWRRDDDVIPQPVGNTPSSRTAGKRISCGTFLKPMEIARWCSADTGWTRSPSARKRIRSGKTPLCADG